MPVLQVVRWFLLMAEVVLALPLFYLGLLSVSALLMSRSLNDRHKGGFHDKSGACAVGACSCDFAVLIPAHNEATIIGKLLESLAGLSYPQERYSIYVIADNCTDDTAEVVRKSASSCGRVQVYERFDLTKRGKGYALNWILQQLEAKQVKHDAYIVLDADSVVEPTFLQALAREMARGAQALQAQNTVLNTAASPSTALRWLALTLMNHVRPLGRNGLGASSTLTGNGMCLSHQLLQRYPWQAFSIGEDYQYYLTLVEHGERVIYVPDAVVRSEMPTSFAQMRTQDIRWESADTTTTWQVSWRLLRAGLRHRDTRRIEALAELLTPPLSLLVCWSLLDLLAALALGTPVELLAGLLLLAVLSSYIGTALYLLRPPRALYKALLHAPRFIFWKLWVYVVLRRSKAQTSEWVRTSRTGI